jgi:hypothetical protein
MSWWLLLTQTLAWLLLGAGGCYLGYQAGRRKECGLWEAWYEQQHRIEQAQLKKDQDMRAVTLTTVQFRRD